jgi:sphinganine-1-phosphate aldolase
VIKNGHKIRSSYKSKADVKNGGEAVARRANGLFFKTNPLHFDIFDGVCQMEAEVIEMCIEMYKGNADVCGIIDTSEADCIRNALLAYREWGKDIKGITKPNVVAPSSFDPSLARFCEVMDVELKTIYVGDKVQFGKEISLNGC